jgi:hypothetical protein
MMEESEFSSLNFLIDLELNSVLAKVLQLVREEQTAVKRH